MYPLEISEEVPTVVTFSTGSRRYERELGRLRASLKRFGLPHSHFEVPDKGQWGLNTLSKPLVLVQARREIRGPILYVDVDAIFHDFPRGLVNLVTGDLGVVQHVDGSFLAGTIFLRDSPGALRFLELWSEKSANVWREVGPPTVHDIPFELTDQSLMNEVISTEVSNRSIEVNLLGVEFALIHGPHRELLGEKGIFIEHLQASRDRHPGSLPWIRRWLRIGKFRLTLCVEAGARALGVR